MVSRRGQVYRLCTTCWLEGHQALRYELDWPLPLVIRVCANGHAARLESFSYRVFSWGPWWWRFAALLVALWYSIEQRGIFRWWIPNYPDDLKPMLPIEVIQSFAASAQAQYDDLLARGRAAMERIRHRR